MQKDLIKVIIFDLDDTLYPERTFVESGFRAVASYIQDSFQINKEDFFKLLIKLLDKQGRGKIFDDALKKYGLYTKELVQKLIEVYRKHKFQIRISREIKDLLQDLRKKYKLALITDGSLVVQKNKVQALGIKKYFDLIIYTDEEGDGKAKPHPHSFRKVMNYFKVKPNQIIHIADDPTKDFVGAKKLGIGTVRVVQGRLKTVNARKSYGADYNIDKLILIKKILLS